MAYGQRDTVVSCELVWGPLSLVASSIEHTTLSPAFQLPLPTYIPSFVLLFFLIIIHNDTETLTLYVTTLICILLATMLANG